MIAREQLKSIVERVERLEEEKKALSDDVKEVYQEAKANGFDVNTLRTVIKLRKLDSAERQEQEALLDLYLQALGMTPLEEFIDNAAKGGMISPEAAEENRKLGAALADRRVRKAAADPKVRKAFKRLGTPVELTEEEKARGDTAALIQKDGTRMTIGRFGQ